MEQVGLLRLFHEIFLKGGNRSLFVRQALHNLRRALQGTGLQVYPLTPLTAVVPLPSDAHWEALRQRASFVFGLELLSRAYRVPPRMDAILEAAERLTAQRRFASFRVTAKRQDKSFPILSPDIERQVGALVQTKTGARVDLENYEVEVVVTVLPRQAFVSMGEERLAGGIPVGVSGTVVALLSGGIDSPVASWRAMRRGCRVVFVHFHSFPLVEGTSREKAQDLVRLLTRWQNHSILYLVPFAEIQKRIILTVPPSHRVVLYRRFMFRIAEALGQAHRAGALVTGESLAQVASQTLTNITTIGAAVQRLPIFRPLIGMDKQEIIAQAKQIGTYPISIIPDQDCCSLFVPRHPSTQVTVAEAERLEAGLDVHALVQEGVRSAERKEYTWPEEEP
ncbi:MAG: tRNA 4-thiouridine(8) synthase ThiI [Dehalococcoidia bacterium]|nr:tRNA 4-thiouridine(8) synthase ThiI [Dehalococcoidia bacterium]MDW8120027.1 tRNA uracil 4-sulfurtransferase ThiI [Chloroflexota bacterium]